LLALLGDSAPARPHAEARTSPTPAPTDYDEFARRLYFKPPKISPRLALRPREPTPPRRKRKAARPADAGWEALRRDVRARMKASGTTYAALSAACGRSAATLQLVLTRTKPASAATQEALRGWLAGAPAVAPPAAAFRGRARPANGSAVTTHGNGTATPP
jgi:hypothetical protein